MRIPGDVDVGDAQIRHVYHVDTVIEGNEGAASDVEVVHALRPDTVAVPEEGCSGTSQREARQIQVQRRSPAIMMP